MRHIVSNCCSIVLGAQKKYLTRITNECIVMSVPSFSFSSAFFAVCKTYQVEYARCHHAFVYCYMALFNKVAKCLFFLCSVKILQEIRQLYIKGD